MDGASELESWRDRLAIRLARFFSWVMVGGGLFLLGLGQGPVRFTVSAICIAGGLLVLLLNASGRFKGRTVSAGIVSVAFVGSMGGYISVGAVPGPAVAIATTLMLGGLLLGRKVMFVLIVLGAVGVSAIGVGFLEGWLPVPPVMTRPLSNHIAWFRTTVISFLIIGLVAHIVTAVIDQIEKALGDAETERVRSAQSERRRADVERKALETRHLETMGRLVSGVAHDFNNNLTAIIGLTELLKAEMPERGSQREMLDDILAASLRSADLTKQLLAYARKGRVQPAATELEPLLESCVTLVRRSLDPNVEVVVELDLKDAVISADQSLLQNAVLNLLLNAKDAMPSGGRLTVRANVEERSPSYSDDGDDKGPSTTRRYAVVSIEDTGTGIAPDVLPRIFEPFFTTKPPGQGTGLGLPAVDGTIRSHGGSIDVHSAIDEGTIFTLRLPLIAAPEELLSESQQAPLRGTGELLVVDDDARVRHAAAALLTALGYTVTLAENGDHAIEIASNSKSRFDLVLLDLRMPGQSGEVTFQALRDIWPDLPVLLWSGRAADGNLDGLLDEANVRYVQKPYRAAELAKSVAEMVTAGKNSDRPERTANAPAHTNRV